MPPAHQLRLSSYAEDEEEDDARYDRDLPRPLLPSDTLRCRFPVRAPASAVRATNAATTRMKMMPAIMASPSFRSPEAAPRGPR
jgi:hypothetical protein